MNRRTFMRLLPALSAFPSIAEAVANQSITTSMGAMQYLRFDSTPTDVIWWREPHWTVEDLDKFMKEAFKYYSTPKVYYFNGEWHGR